MKTLVLRAGLVAILLVITGCDYGMSIRQLRTSDRDSKSSRTTDSQIVVNVETAQRLIGNTSYTAAVNITNASGGSINVSKIDLLAQEKTYENEPTQFTTYPFTIQAGSTERVGAYFRLDDDVENTFHKPADLRVFYRIGKEERVIHVSVIGEEKGLKQLFHRD